MTPVSTRFISALALLASTSLVLACSSGQIGGEVTEVPDNDMGTEGGGSCEDGEVTELSPETVSSLGFAPADAIALASGNHTAPLAWGNVPEGIDLELTPAAGEAQIEVTVTVDLSTVRLVKQIPIENSGSQAGTEEGNPPVMALPGGSGCSDEVRFDAEVQLSASNGALDDTFEVTFVSTSPYESRATIPVAPGELTGSFTVAVRDPNSEMLQTALTLAFTPGGMSGTLGGVYQTNSAEATSALFVAYGSFPMEACPTGAIVGADSDFAAEMVATLDGLRELDLTWSGAEATTLTLSHEVGMICFESGYSGGEAEAVLQVQTAASTADGRIDGTWQLEARVALASDGTAEEVTLIRQAYLSDIFTGAEFEAETGISGVSLPEGADGTFMLGLTDTLGDDTPASGTLATYAVTAADCSAQEPVEDPNTGEAASPGCAGTTADELETATITGR